MSKGYDYPLELEFTEQEEQYFSALDKKEDPITVDNVIDFLKEEYKNKDFSDFEDFDALLKSMEEELEYQFDRCEHKTVITEELDFEEVTILKMKIDQRATFRRQYLQHLATFELEQGEAPYDLF